jgi:hypothetical protein
MQPELLEVLIEKCAIFQDGGNEVTLITKRPLAVISLARQPGLTLTRVGPSFFLLKDTGQVPASVAASGFGHHLGSALGNHLAAATAAFGAHIYEPV